MATIIVNLVRSRCSHCKRCATSQWSCPECSGKFCNYCFKEIYERDGDQCQCPHCQEMLDFPNIPDLFPELVPKDS